MKSVPDNPIGRLIATESKPTTTSNVRFWLDPDARLKPFDIVRMVPPNKGDGEFYVIIDEISQVTDEHSLLTGFISSDFGQPTVQPRVNRVATTYADGTVLYNTKNNEMPVPYGSTVHWPEKEGVREALGIADIRNPVPAGFITMSGPQRETMSIPVDMDADYLIGPEGAHINISGISGLATKTSYAMFLLSAIQQIQQKQESSAEKSAFVILNVKGDDLLSLDEGADNLTDDEKKQWMSCGLEAKPFQNVSYFYPFSRTANHVQSYVGRDQLQKQLKKNNAYRYHYDVATAISRLKFLFEDIEDPNQTLVSCAEYTEEHLSASDSLTWTRFRERVREWAGTTPVKEIPVVSWRRFSRLTNQRIKNALFAQKVNDADKLFQVPLWRFHRCLKPGHVVVIDIARLPDYLQSYVVGDIIATLLDSDFDTSIEDESDNDILNGGESDIAKKAKKVVLFADELNKYAPKIGKARTLTASLREVSERGRSLGLVLFGAEQFRTSVDERVTGNAGSQVFGRTTPVEVNRAAETKDLPKSQKSGLPRLHKGELLLQHPRFTAATLKINFPKNAYKTG